MSTLGAISFKTAFSLATNNDLEGLIRKLQECNVLHQTEDCTGCGSAMKLTRRCHNLDGYVWQCTVKKCQRRLSIRSGSWFARGHLSIGTQFLLVYNYLRYDKMLSKYIADICGVHENTVVTWECYIRESISHYFMDNPLKLGLKNTVQIDESLFGGRCKYHRGDHSRHQQSWVFGIAEEGTGLNVLWMVNDRSRATLLQLIKAHVHNNATIKSD
jgi:hypothetical protein